jgi:lysozyme
MKNLRNLVAGISIGCLAYAHNFNSVYAKEPDLDMPAEGIELIKEAERFSSKPYLDAGKYSIGYGHQIKPEEKYRLVDESQAESLLRNDIREAESAVSRSVNVPLNQNQYGALVCLAYNIGSGNFRKSTLLKKLNSGNYSGAASEFQRWNRSGGKVLKGLQIRREKERALFLKK